MFFIILGFILILGFCVYRIINGASKQPIKADDENIDSLIKRLKLKIMELEEQSLAGMENAEAQLVNYKEKLKNAELLKTKTKEL